MDKATVARTAKLARLHIEEKEQERLAGQLSQIFGLIEKLNEVNTDNVAPMVSAIPHDGHWRTDAVTDGGKASEIVANAPDATENFFVVPKVVDGSGE